MNTNTLKYAIALVMGAALTASVAIAAKPPNAGGGGKPPGGETAANNLSFPVILSDNVGPAAFPADGAWRFATITDPSTQCIGEAGVTPGTPVPPEYLCYYGRHVTVVSETGAIVFDGAPKVWWLQKRTQNFWKTLSVGHDVSTPLAVSAVDVGDLLESSPQIATRQIRVEFNMLQNVAADDPELGQYVGVSNCVVPTASGQSAGCFAALGMSGAVPGTEQSGNEMQGTDFGPGPLAGELTGTQTFLDPTTVRAAVDEDGNAIPVHALVYSRCARLVIQRITGTPVWNPGLGQWDGAAAPVVNVAAYGTWGVEITSGGSIVYGNNWNAKTAPTGIYRLSFVLDGKDAIGPQCGILATKFEAGVTKLVNPGEANQSSLIYAGDAALNGGDEGGIAYLDLALTAKGGGGGGGKPR